MEQDDFWQKIESMLRNYQRGYTPLRWFRSWGGWTSGRIGYFAFF
jgi:hypothetical protein